MILYWLIPGLTKRPKELSDIKQRRDRIIEIVCNHYNTGYGRLQLKLRKREVVLPRQVLMYMLKKNTSMTLKQIGYLFQKDHTTVIHAMQTVDDLCIEELHRHDIMVVQSKIEMAIN